MLWQSPEEALTTLASSRAPVAINFAGCCRLITAVFPVPCSVSHLVTSAMAAASRSTLPELTPAMLMRPLRVCMQKPPDVEAGTGSKQ